MRLAVALLAAIGTAACGPQGSNGQAPAAEVTVRPGLWEVTSRVVTVSAPNAPPEIQEQIRANASMAPTVQRDCVTPAEAADPGLALRNQLNETQGGYSCSPGESLFANGRIRMLLNCRSNSGGPGLRQAMVGSFTAESMQIAISAETALPATSATDTIPVRVESTMFGRRVGECPAGGAAN